MTEFKVIDTKDLQIKSLLDFCKDYVPVDSERLCKGFVCKTHSGTFYQSFSHLVWLHNNCYGDNKLVEQVKLQRDKSQSDGVKCQNHMVKLTEKGKELYEHLRSL